MERYFFRITITLITFFLGLGATLLWATLRAPDVRDLESAPAPVIQGGLLNDKMMPPTILLQGIPCTSFHIIVDETGRVISVSSDIINPVERYNAEKEVYGYRFKQTLVSGQPVKVAGEINNAPCIIM
ncbi:MAG: hypothetical protein ACJ74W_02090 [Pyrinomonadaceae bacterium]